MDITLVSIPDSGAAFAALQEQLAGEPQGAAAVMVAALLIYQGDPDLGLICLAQSVDEANLHGGKLHPNTSRRLALQFNAQPYLAQSYISDTSPEDGYALPAAPYTIVVETNPYSGDVSTGLLKVFVTCQGASKPRPVTLRRDRNGIWKAREWSSLIMGVVPASVQSR